MSTVFLTGPLKDLAGGVDQFELDVANVRRLIDVLGDRYPALKPRLESGLTVAIDGEVYHDAWVQPIPSDSEVHLISAMAGG
ncbi:MAG: MoaD/ThiS family protein [Hyphomicrobiales bacterium]|nr:MoaD/ThiS family protein [Hyphomicrobiales bacterium]